MSDIFLSRATVDPQFEGACSDRFDIPPGQTMIGRSAEANIVLSSPDISRLHAVLERDGRIVWLIDLKSTNGTYVNDCRLESNQKVMLYPGERIRLGNSPLFDGKLIRGERHEFFIHGNRMTNLMFDEDEPDVTSMNDVPMVVPPAVSRSPLADQGHVGSRPSVESDWHPGDRIENRWEVQQVLHGGMGIVYVVLDLETGERLAAKTYRDDLLTANPDLARRFEREALAWINLGSHPNIVKARYVRTLHHKPFLFLEYIEGGSLQALLPSLSIGEFPDGDETNYFGDFHIFLKSLQIQDLAMSFCNGMIHASRLGIRSHRDIKAANCLVSHDGWKLKITDFGLASIFDGVVATTDVPYVFNVGTEEGRAAYSPPGETVYEARVPDRLSIFVTRTGAMVGTPSHMALEQFNDSRHVDVKADIYSFGVMLFQMITGRLPFTARTLMGYQHRHQNVVPHRVNLGYFTGIVERCLAKNPDRRFASFLELHQALQGTVWDPEKTYYERYGESPVPGDELTEDELVQKGLSLAELGRYPLALAAFNDTIERHPRGGKGWREKGNLLMKVVHDFPEALQSLERAKELGELGLEEQIAFCRDQLPRTIG
jgi:serine/threonine protein kinase